MNTMLPALPKSFGRLTDVFISALGSITGLDNRLNFSNRKKVCVVLVDGLGTHNLKSAAGHAPFLNQSSVSSKPISCGFPSTTASSITSFATGLSVGEHGLVGYQIFDHKNHRPANLLTGWSELQVPLDYQPASTVSELALAASVPAYVIGPPEYGGSGFTAVTMRSARYLPAKSMFERVSLAKSILSGREEALIYLYVPELDQTAHAYGSQSGLWLQNIEALDSAIKHLCESLPVTAGVVLTADHGIIDVDPASHIFLDECLSDRHGVKYVGGDPRVNFIYLQDEERTETVVQAVSSFVGDFAWVLSKSDVQGYGLYQRLTAAALNRLPEVMVLARKRVALYDRNFAKSKSLKMIGQHGSISTEELSIPLITWGF